MPVAGHWRSEDARDQINRAIDQRWAPPVPPYVWYDIGEIPCIEAIPPDALRDIVLWCFGPARDDAACSRIAVMPSRLMPGRHLLRLARPQTFPFRFTFAGTTHPIYQLGGVEELGEVSGSVVNLRTLLPGPGDDSLALCTTRHNIP